MNLRKKIAIIISIALLLVGTIILCAIFFISDDKTDSETQTVMIYMIGSDLESEYGMASMDLEEITATGLDTDKHNVIVYIGGAEEWQNDISAESNHIYRLNKDKFEPIDTLESDNMGEADTLYEFLSWTYDNYKTDSYALVLWNHGGGPNVGYGSDEKYGFDCLTLDEMKDALERSPFNETNKIEWVSFDACLMASVELAEIFSPYANYLIASQESEPSFGHNYQYLSCLSEGDVSGYTVGNRIASEYMSYYNELVEYDSGYECDITISCMDLNKFEPVKNAMDALFEDANSGIYSGDFGKIKRRRAKTKSFGAYTTSNSYDLVDLYSLADNLGDLYPSGKALKDALEEFVVINETNVPNANGVSVYYPFENSEYQIIWMEEYDNISPSENYMTFLKSITQNIDVANSDTSVKYEDVDWHFTGDNIVDREELGFSLKLTDEQKAYTAYAHCTIFTDSQDEEYKEYYSPCAIEKKIVYDENSEFFVEIENYVVEMNDSEGEVGYIYVSAPEAGRELVQVSGMLFNTELESLEFHTVDINLKLSEDGRSYDILQSVKTSHENDSYVSDKQYLNIKDYEYLQVMWPIYGITFEDDGTVKSFDDWIRPDVGIGYEVQVNKNGVEFKLADITKEDESKFHAVFNVCDIYGNMHMSPLIELK